MPGAANLDVRTRQDSDARGVDPVAFFDAEPADRARGLRARSDVRTATRLAVVLLLAATAAVASCSRHGASGGIASATSAGTASGSATDASFGTLRDVCGPAPAGMRLRASDRGVSAASISITTISDPGFQSVPGLNQELFDASTVFTRWCNALGGINGRKISDHLRDAAVFSYKQRVLDGCQHDFAMVGGGGAIDDSGQTARLGCLLPDYPGFVVSPAARGADLMVQSQPNPLHALGIGLFRYLATRYPDSVGHVAYLTGNVPTLITAARQDAEGGTKAGFTTSEITQYSALGEPTWTPFAQTLKIKGIRGLVFVGEPSGLAKMERAMQAIGYYPDWIWASANFYDQSFLRLGGNALQRTYISMSTPPYTDRSNPAVAKYFALFQRYLPGGKSRAVLGLASFSAWLLFARAAKACGAELTRRCVYDHARAVTTWDAGGLVAPTDLSGRSGRACFDAMLATSKGFERVDVHPNRGIYNCSAANVAVLTGDYGKGATLASVGKSLRDLP